MTKAQLVSQKLKSNGSTFSDQQGQDWLNFSFKKTKEDKREVAVCYFRLLSAFNNFKLSDSEIELLAHISVNKGIVSGSCKISYAQNYNSSVAAVDNIISKLKKKKLLVKIENVVMLQPKIFLDFNTPNNFIFSFKCVTKTST